MKLQFSSAHTFSSDSMIMSAKLLNVSPLINGALDGRLRQATLYVLHKERSISNGREHTNSLRFMRYFQKLFPKRIVFKTTPCVRTERQLIVVFFV